jgi:hypothetical protein
MKQLPTDEFNARVEKMRAVVFDDLATVDVAAAALGKSRRQIFRLIETRQLPAVRIGRNPYVVISSLREVLFQHGDLRAAGQTSPARKSGPRRTPTGAR